MDREATKIGNNREEMIEAAREYLRSVYTQSVDDNWSEVIAGIDIPDDMADFAAEQVATQTADAQAEIKRLREALEQWRCGNCQGKGRYNLPCSLCGDSTYDHYCNDETRLCKTCEGTGKHPLAQQALEQENQQEEK